MQAIFFFALFGLFLSVVQGIVGSVTSSTTSIIDRQRTDTAAFMQDIATHYNDYITQRTVYVPQRNYLRDNEVRQSVNWPWSNGNTERDPWGTDFLVAATYENHAILASNVGGLTRAVQPQAFGMVIASAGSDRQFSLQVANAIGAIGTSTPINTLMRIEAPTGSDDIVYTFNNRRALEKRWAIVQNAVEELASTVVYQYRQQFFDPTFRTNLEDYYQFVFQQDLGTDISNTLEAWRTPISGYPRIANLAASAPNYNIYVPQINGLGSNSGGLAELLERNTNLPGGRNTAFNIQATTATSLAGGIVADIFTIRLTPPATSAWRSSAGEFSFFVQVRD